MGLSAGTGKLCIFDHLGLVFIWSCFVSWILLLLYYVICAPVLTEGTRNIQAKEFYYMSSLFSAGFKERKVALAVTKVKCVNI